MRVFGFNNRTAYNADIAALLGLKGSFSNADSALAGWNDPQGAACLWAGVTCDGEGRVVAL